MNKFFTNKNRGKTYKMFGHKYPHLQAHLRNAAPVSAVNIKTCIYRETCYTGLKWSDKVSLIANIDRQNPGNLLIYATCQQALQNRCYSPNNGRSVSDDSRILPCSDSSHSLHLKKEMCPHICQLCKFCLRMSWKECYYCLYPLISRNQYIFVSKSILYYHLFKVLYISLYTLYYHTGEW